MFLVFFFLLMEGCAIFRSPSSVISQTRSGLQAYTIQKIAILPFQSERSDPDVGDRIADIFYLQFLAYGRHEIALKSDVSTAQTRVESKLKEAGKREVAVEVGKSLGVDAVLVGEVLRYIDRHGTNLSADRPASVAFVSQLINIKDGETLWQAKFDETQVPLSENLLSLRRFLKAKGAWLTSDELARLGVQETLMTFPGLEGLTLPNPP